MRALLFLIAAAAAACGNSASYTGPLACGASSCDPSTEYCEITYYGHPLDGGPSSSAACLPYPDSCSSKSCDCFGGQSQSQCGCSQTTSGVTVGQCTP